MTGNLNISIYNITVLWSLERVSFGEGFTSDGADFIKRDKNEFYFLRILLSFQTSLFIGGGISSALLVQLND